VYTVSAVAGPLMAGASIKASHGDALMWLAAAAASVMVLLLRWWLREPLPAGPVRTAGRL